MKSKLPLVQLICLLVTIFSLFLPYKEYDITDWGAFGVVSEENVREAGIKFVEAYIPSVILLIALIPVMIKRTRATAIISMVVSFGNLLYLPFLAFVLTFEIFSPRNNVTVELGYYLAVLAGLVFFGMSIYTLRKAIQEFKIRKPMTNMDLLDDM